MQTQSHIIANSRADVSYDRYTTKFVIRENDEVIYSVFLGLLPFRKSEIEINSQSFTVKIFWLVLWQAKIEKQKVVIIEELLYRRRRQSLAFLTYLFLMTSVKIGFVLLSKT